MINEYIKKLIFVLLLSLLIYIIVILFPKISILLSSILSIILPVIISFILAFILNPLVIKIQRKVKKRNISVVIVVLSIAILIALFLLYTIPIVKEQFVEFQNTIPEIIEYFKNILNNINDYISKVFNDKSILDEINLEERLYSFFESFLNIGNKMAKNIIYFLSSVFIIPILTVYFLNDYDNICIQIKSFLLNKKKERLYNYLSDLSSSMRTYVKGVLLVMLILFVIFTIIFTFLGIPYSLVFALFIAITNIIPYFGSYIGAALPVLFALSDSYYKAIITIALCTVIQIIEANIISPMVQKKFNKINPLHSILAILIFGRLFGFIGLVIAIPMVNVIKITLKYYPIKLISDNK